MPREFSHTSLYLEGDQPIVKTFYKDMNVRFLVSGQWNGINYSTDDTATMRFDLAESFIKNGEAVEIE